LGFLSFEFAQLARAVVGLATGQNKLALELDVIDCQAKKLTSAKTRTPRKDEDCAAKILDLLFLNSRRVKPLMTRFSATW